MKNKSIIKAFSCAVETFYKELFVKFAIDYDNEVLYKVKRCGQVSCFRVNELNWLLHSTTLPQNIVWIDREEADYIEYMWKKENKRD